MIPSACVDADARVRLKIATLSRKYLRDRTQPGSMMLFMIISL
jgi:hypothetical protein